VTATLSPAGIRGTEVKVDEIGRETLMGMGPRGEWVILYACLGLQLAYLLALLVQREPLPTDARS
jgi:hypothetical protein